MASHPHQDLRQTTPSSDAKDDKDLNSEIKDDKDLNSDAKDDKDIDLEIKDDEDIQLSIGMSLSEQQSERMELESDIHLSVGLSLSELDQKLLLESDRVVESDIHLSVGLSLSELEENVLGLMSVSERVLDQFINHVVRYQFMEAADLYYESVSEQPILIQFANSLPWRIACEYHLVENELQWMQSWIKLGWWDQEVETADELSRGLWVSQQSPYASLGSDQYYAVVWEGSSKHKPNCRSDSIGSLNSPSNLYSKSSLNSVSDPYSDSVPIQIILQSLPIYATKLVLQGPLYLLQTTPIYDADLVLQPTLQIGSLEPTLRPHILDSQRRLLAYFHVEDRYTFYHGSPNGDVFLSETTLAQIDITQK